MLVDAYINGLRLIPGIDYVSTDGTISFSSPPNVGADIMINMPLGAGGAHVLHHTGDGLTYLFPISSIDEKLRVYGMVEAAVEYSHVPAVADALEKLRVVLELVKEHDNIR